MQHLHRLPRCHAGVGYDAVELVRLARYRVRPLVDVPDEPVAVRVAAHVADLLVHVAQVRGQRVERELVLSELPVPEHAAQRVGGVVATHPLLEVPGPLRLRLGTFALADDGGRDVGVVREDALQVLYAACHLREVMEVVAPVLQPVHALQRVVALLHGVLHLSL